MSSRTTRYRHRLKNGTAIISMEVNYFSLIEALIATGNITEAAAEDRKNVEAAAEAVLNAWIEAFSSGLL